MKKRVAVGLGVGAVVIAGAALVVAISSRGEPEPVLVRVRLDGKNVAELKRSELSRRVSLGELIGPLAPLDKWRWLGGSSADGRTLGLGHYSRDFASHDAFLYLEQDQPRLGVFRRSRPDQPAHVRKRLETPEHVLANPEIVEVRTLVDEDAGTPAPNELAWMSSPSERKPIATASIFALELVDPREEAKEEGESSKSKNHKGWRLAEVIALVDSTAATKNIRVLGDDGKSMIIDVATMNAPDRALVRVNKRGQWICSQWKADAANVESLRGVRQLEPAP